MKEAIETFANPFTAAGWIAGAIIAACVFVWIWRAAWAWRIFRQE